MNVQAPSKEMFESNDTRELIDEEVNNKREWGSFLVWDDASTKITWITSNQQEIGYL